MCEDCSGRRVQTRRQVLAPGRIDRRVLAVPVADGLAIYPRTAWADDSRPARGPMPPETVQFYLVHHTAGSNEYDEDGAVREMRSAYDLHTGPDKGWNDVAYNFFIDRFGRVFEGRSGSLDGPVTADATAGSQGFAQLICLLGNFMTTMPSDDALNSLQRTIAWMSQRDGVAVGPEAITTFVSRGSNRWPAGEEVTTNTIAGHRDMSFTECPGDTFYPYVHDSLPATTAALIAATTATTNSTSTTSTVAATTSSPTPPTSTASPTPTTLGKPTGPTGPTVTTPSAVQGGEAQHSGGGNSLLLDAGLAAAAVAVGGIGWVISRRMRHT